MPEFTIAQQTLLGRLESKFTPVPFSGCFVWLSELNVYGYAVYTMTINGKHKHFLAHRLMYELFKGPIPQGLVLDHLCRVTCCVNPHHLEAVTHIENVRRGEAGKYLSKRTHCNYGHEFNKENTIWKKGGGGTPARRCRACEYQRTTERLKRRQLIARAQAEQPASAEHPVAEVHLVAPPAEASSPEAAPWASEAESQLASRPVQGQLFATLPE